MVPRYGRLVAGTSAAGMVQARAAWYRGTTPPSPVVLLLRVALLRGECPVDARQALDDEAAQCRHVGVRVEPCTARIGQCPVREGRRVEAVDELLGDGVAARLPDVFEHGEVPLDEGLEQRRVGCPEEALGGLANDGVRRRVDLDERRPGALLALERLDGGARVRGRLLARGRVVGREALLDLGVAGAPRRDERDEQ